MRKQNHRWKQRALNTYVYIFRSQICIPCDSVSPRMQILRTQRATTFQCKKSTFWGKMFVIFWQTAGSVENIGLALKRYLPASHRTALPYIMFISHCRSVDMFCHIELHFVFYRLLKPSGVFYTYFVLSKPGLGRGGVSILALIYIHIHIYRDMSIIIHPMGIPI